jgi:hypothetical protein
LLANASPNYLTRISNAGKLLWPLLLEEQAPAASAATPTTTSIKPVAPASSALPSADDLLARMIAAQGGERNLRRHTSVEVRAQKRYENQGVVGDLVIRASAPFCRTEDETWTAAERNIGHLRTYFDGSRGGQETTFGQDSTLTGDEIEPARRKSALHLILDLRDLFTEIKVEGEKTFDREAAYVVRLRPKRGSAATLLVSARTALLLEQEIDGETTTFHDYRNVDGEVVPFRTTIHDALGETTIEVTDIHFNVAIPPAAFGASARSRLSPAERAQAERWYERAMAMQYRKFLTPMNEPPLWRPSKKGHRVTVYRFLWLPSFHNPVAVRIVKSERGAVLHAVRLCGAGGYEPGSIIEHKRVRLSPALWKRIASRLDDAKFWTLPKREPPPPGVLSMDGDELIVEGVKDGRYHIVMRDDSPGREFVNLCQAMLFMSGFDVRKTWFEYRD